MPVTKKHLTVALCVAVGMGISSLQAAYLIEVDTDGLDDGILQPSPGFAFGGDTTAAGQSGAASAIGLTGGDSIFGGNGVSEPDTYVFSYAPQSNPDNLYFDPGTPLGDGNYASGASGGIPGRYAVYATWPTSGNVNGGPTTYRVVTAGDSSLFSVDQNSIGDAWVKVGEIDYTNGLITVTQTPDSNTYVSMRAAGILFERMDDGSGGGDTGPPGPLIFGQGTARTFGLAFARNRAAASTNHFAVLQSTNLLDWSNTDLKLVSITDADAETELVTFRLMAPMEGNNHQFLKVQLIPKMPATAPFVAMTFDDGPHPDHTPALLDILAERNLRATFYLVGSNAQQFPEIVRRMINEGHEIGNHSMTHDRLTDLTDEGVVAEMLGCRDAVVAAATLSPVTMRPPYGAVDNNIRNLVLTEFGYPTVLWDVDPRDWDMAVSDEQVVDTILTESDHGEIILTHDIHARTIAVMPEILDGLLVQGFSFVTVTELLELED
ncbi:Peptidoglycan-N-acetylglucosamine deacetylase [Pontiella desulfatans]|uniref:Peptidoglycan-N-acetylglucosamine deacetylase n=1 Tax=Pontiella desulfatans TaxID=2750659 RepID=A0A6C2UBU2_PONDE|nr:polysaccharide deacetylase family protein [Pontiella desulfatans]VGO17560.1 Peptidoglycan-N-acetylglucosamine deacetylase [Pontiella desulfatans]